MKQSAFTDHWTVRRIDEKSTTLSEPEVTVGSHLIVQQSLDILVDLFLPCSLSNELVKERKCICITKEELVLNVAWHTFLRAGSKVAF